MAVFAREARPKPVRRNSANSGLVTQVGFPPTRPITDATWGRCGADPWSGAGAVSREPCKARSDGPAHSARLPVACRLSAKDRFRAPRQNPLEFRDHPRTRTHHAFQRLAEDERLLSVQSRDLHRVARE